MAPSWSRYRRPPWRPRPTAVFASFRFRRRSRSESRPPGKGAQRDDRGAGCEVERERGRLGARVTRPLPPGRSPARRPSGLRTQASRAPLIRELRPLPLLHEARAAWREKTLPPPHQPENFLLAFPLITEGDAPGVSPEPSPFLSVGWNWDPWAVNRARLMKIEIGPAPHSGQLVPPRSVSDCWHLPLFFKPQKAAAKLV
uniref:Uncharacterized protein n=1 Tax=Molossus molossus TaxID=27622 RepID=A0A7J8DPU8_MOLMO|nr:hypothetical protein HJG59_009297 [Molossus molossus]